MLPSDHPVTIQAEAQPSGGLGPVERISEDRGCSPAPELPSRAIRWTGNSSAVEFGSARDGRATGHGIAAMIELADTAPVALRRPIRGLLWITGWLRALHREPARQVALELISQRCDERLLDVVAFDRPATNPADLAALELHRLFGFGAS